MEQQGFPPVQKPKQRGYGIVAVDFDGTIAHYDGWQGPGIFGDPIAGCKEALEDLKQRGYRIVVFTTRGVDLEDVRRYLVGHDIPFDEVNENCSGTPDNLSHRKVIADVYIDDRAMHFDGSWKGIPDKVDWFQPWYRRTNQRPSLNLQVCGYHVDQVSLYVPDVAASIKEYTLCGHPSWVVDEVMAFDTFDDDREFHVKLAFNYTIYPCEFELIQVVAGRTVQIPTIGVYKTAGKEGLSHYGFHVDDFNKAIKAFERCNYPLMSKVETVQHSQCPYLYRYAFMDTRKLGFIAKLIKRA